MKKIAAIFIALILMLCLGACTAKNGELTTWQEQYDLGVRYLSEGNYGEAILAFTAAIEIDPKRADAYVGRGGAYMLSGETEQNLAAAKSDYEMAIALDEMIAEAYLGLAGVYVAMGDLQSAEAVLRQGYDATGDSTLLEVAERLTGGGGSGVDTSQDELQLGNVLQAEGVVSYSDLPSVLFVPFNQLDSYLPVVNRMTDGLYMEHEWSNNAGASFMVHDCDYDSNTEDDTFADIVVVAPLNGTEILRISIRGGPIGLRDIQIGDSYAAVVEKLGLDPALADYADININLFAEDEGYGFASRESHHYSNGVPEPGITVHFGTSWENYEGQNAFLSFNESGVLYLVFLSNDALMEQMG